MVVGEEAANEKPEEKVYPQGVLSVAQSSANRVPASLPKRKESLLSSSVTKSVATSPAAKTVSQAFRTRPSGDSAAGATIGHWVPAC